MGLGVYDQRNILVFLLGKYSGELRQSSGQGILLERIFKLLQGLWDVHIWIQTGMI